MEPDLELVALYQWTCRTERQLEKLKSAFPEALRNDQNRLIASFRCLRVGLEFRVYPPYQRTAGRPPQTPGGDEAESGSTPSARGRADGSGTPNL